MNLPSLTVILADEITNTSFQNLINQLDKDFKLTGIEYNFDDLNPKQLVVCLHEVITHLLQTNYATFLNLLYRIDIPEDKITFTAQFTTEEHLVLLILKREWLKVQYKLKYSKKQGSFNKIRLD